MVIQTTPNRVLRMAENCKKTGLSQSKIHDMVAKGIFPKPFTLVPGGRAVGWLEDDIDQYILDRKCESQGSES
jgi:prophage regulatory protein